MIYRNKKVLKEKGIHVMEILTAYRIKMLEKAKELHGFVNVWYSYHNLGNAHLMLESYIKILHF